MYDEILIPTDGSQAAEEAAQEAFKLADLCDATVHIIHVGELSHRATVDSLAGLEGSVLTKEAISAQKDAGEKLTSALAEEAASQEVNYITKTMQGFAPDAIIEYVADNGIDLIVMGTHGRSGLDRWLLGSVTERVIRQAEVPVHVVRSSE